MTSEELKALIAKHAATPSGSPEEAVDQLFKMLEPLAEDKGLQTRFSTALVEHIEERNKEIQSFRTARRVFLWISVIAIVLVLALFYFVILSPAGERTLTALGNGRIAFVSATFLASFGLLAIILRGVFRVGSADDAGPVGEAVKAMFEAGKGIAEKAG